MTDTDLLRSSRDGDQFHYHWAARQALKLLRPDTDLTAIVVEGVSQDDTSSTAGEQVIDLAEYYGSSSLQSADRVVYRQLKHSTVNADEEWTVSGLSKTIGGFAEKFRQIRSEFPGAERKVSFDFVSNRPVRDSVLQAIEIVASQTTSGDSAHDVKYIKKYAKFSDDLDGEALFFSLFRIDATAPGLLSLESLFRLDLSGFLPGAPDVEHVLLKEMIARRATSLEPDPVIEQSTVLMALRVTHDRLLPAPNLIRPPKRVIATRQTQTIISDITGLVGRPVIVHAAGGIGKSVFATQVERILPEGSITLVYDCFGNGGYRRSSAPRHEHQQGLVQLSNELAAHALCDPLIPSATARPADYCKAFIARVQTAADTLSARSPDALLTVIVDAADNAALIASDSGERTFVTDLLREPLPANVRLLMLCRTERIDLLDPPPEAHKIELTGFDVDQTKQHIETVFAAVTDHQAAEFHRRTGGNPRVQAFVFETAQDIDACLESLGEARQVDGTLLDGLLQNLVDKCKDTHRGAAFEIDRLCEALAALRPWIPIRVLNELCGVSPALIHSFVADLKRPLLIDGDTLQFRDEPTETWFRNRYRPSGTALVDFIDRLTPLAATEPYVAASLPQLLWEAEQVDTLVNLALTDSALPQGNDLEQREIAQQRAQYALKATLRGGRDFESARLALKAGALAAGHSRRLRLLRRNTDLAGQFLDARIIEDLVATRSLSGDWPGSNLHYEGALLSAAPGQSDFARSRLRSATDWIRAWVRQSHDRGDHGIGADDIAEVAFGLLNTDGIDACIDYLSRWKPNRVAFDTGLIIATRLADAGRIDELEGLGSSATRLKYLQFAVACAAWKANIICGAPLARRLVKMLKRQRRPISFRRHRQATGEHRELRVVAWIVAMGLRHGVLSNSDAERVLGLCLPKDLGNGAGSRYNCGTETLLSGFALLAKARQQVFDVNEVAGDDVVDAKKHRNHSYSQTLSDYERNIIPLAAWAALWIDALVGTDIDIEARFKALANTTLKEYSDHETPHLLINGVARFAARILALGSLEESRRFFLDWCSRTERHIGVATLIDVVRTAVAAPDLENVAVGVAELVRASLDAAHEDAEYKAEQMVKLARATYRFDPVEALAHFTHAIDLTDRVGDDVHARWRVLLALAKAASASGHTDDRRAYRVAQLVEGLDSYLGDYTDYSDALIAIAHLSATTAISVASRWRDRRVCSEWPFIKALATEGGSPLASDPVMTLAVLPFDDNIDALRLLQQAFRHAPADGRRIAGVIGEFVRHKRFLPESFDRLDQVARDLDIDLTGTPFAPDSRRIASNYADSGTSSRWITDDNEAHAERVKQEQQTLASYDLTTIDGWEAARKMIKESEFTLHSEHLIDQAVRVPLSGLDDMLTSFLANPHFATFDYNTMIKRLAELPLLPRAARQQIHHLAQTAATRFCRELTTKSYDPLDLRALAQLADTPAEDLLGTALRELGSQPAAFDSDECFNLASRLARRLPSTHAQVVLDDLADMLAQVAPTDSSDGEFDALPAVPARISECIAGYLWVGLGAPEADIRWRAAHSVRLLVALGCAEELDALHRYALGILNTSPFIDARLPFYSKHALQWLLLALARAIQDPMTHRAVSVFVPLLRKVMFNDDPHVVMQESAKSALSALFSSQVVDLMPEEQSICRSINVPTTIIRQSCSDRVSKTRGDLLADHADSARDDITDSDGSKSNEFDFFMDFSDHWCRPLAKAFGISQDAVQRHAGRIITDQWGLSYRGKHKEDPRYTLKMYQGKGTHVYKSDWPQEEDLDFYLAIHALWTAAGDLVRNRPVYHDLDAQEDLFTDWLREFLISRDDDRWLADRRDPPPDSVFTSKYSSPDRDWIWRLASRDFAERLLTAEGWVTVWEHSDDMTYQAAQKVQIRSALATSDKARALALALQTAPSYMAFRIPTADDDDYQYSAEGFELTGWVIDQSSCDGQDSKDPLAASVRYPPPHPSEEIVRLLGLVPDFDMRTWTRAGELALRSTVWNDTVPASQNQVTGTQGDRLEIRREDLVNLLTATGRSLIVEVMINRTHEEHERSYTRMRSQDDDDSFPFLERSFKIYLFDASGGCGEL